MIEFVVYIIILNIICEFLQILFPHSKLSSFIRSSLSILVIYLICLKISTFII